MSSRELERLISAASDSNTLETSCDLLRFIRNENLRLPKLVMKYGEPLVNTRLHALKGDERWLIIEQVCVAALDSSDFDTADQCIELLHAKFPKSVRVDLLQCLRFESIGEFDKSNQIYKLILSENPANAKASKQSIAALIAQGKTSMAAYSLNQHLLQNCGDVDAWTQLANLHISQCNYESAVFCYEELILIDPTDSHNHCRLAELYFTLSSPDMLLKARKHFSQSLELSRGKVRALHGLCITCTALMSDKSNSKVLRTNQNVEVNAALFSWASDELKKMYERTEDSDVAKAVSIMLRQQELAVSEES